MRILIPAEEEYNAICSLMESCKVPGVSFAIIRDGAIVSSTSLGESCGTPIAFDTRFEAASLTKPLFTYFIMTLCEQGIINLDTPICTYLPNERTGADERYRLITPRHVLCHGGGFPNWSDVKPIPQLFSPGEGFEYSGEGYHYLQRAVENIFSAPLNQLMSTLLQQLSMNHSALSRTDEITRHMSRSYDKNGTAEPFPQHGYKPNAAYSLYTTAEDYARFLCDFMSDNSRVSEQYKAQMTSPHNKINDRVLWGLGLGIVPSEVPVYWHWGDNDGFKSFMCFCPRFKTGITIFTNGFGGTRLCVDTAHMLTGVDFSHVDAFLATTV